jgi:GNAT superfamily N-acetyltransferase
MRPLIRPARADDVPFLAWVVLAASRSHLERGIWDLALQSTDAELLAFLEAFLTSPDRHFCHHTGFLVAEVGGQRAAALLGYAHESTDLTPPGEAIAATAKRLGRTDEQVATLFRRMGPFLACLPTDEPGAWIVEWVATHLDFRRRGIIDHLLRAELQVGRDRGHRVAQIMILAGNLPAKHAYERVGFEVVEEKLSADLERAIGSPGLVRFLMSL